jgi:hypothetical protein
MTYTQGQVDKLLRIIKQQADHIKYCEGRIEKLNRSIESANFWAPYNPPYAKFSRLQCHGELMESRFSPYEFSNSVEIQAY